jgi:hypothetical protein
LLQINYVEAILLVYLLPKQIVAHNKIGCLIVRINCKKHKYSHNLNCMIMIIVIKLKCMLFYGNAFAS